jgi:uncharacterized membrane protein YgdD (TMEM256/DUF423 family)
MANAASPAALDEALRGTETEALNQGRRMMSRSFTAARALSALACLMGAGGVIAAAAAAHLATDTRMGAASQILMVHAAASLALATRAAESRIILLSTALLQAGAMLFSADMTVRTLAGHPLFPSAAPIGGTILILAWLTAAAKFALTPTSTGQ